MRSIRAWLAAAAVVVVVGTPTLAGAAGYDASSPVSTGCGKRGLVDETRTIRTYGVWNVRLRRSTDCKTVWAVVTRTDGKKCRLAATCAKVRLTRIKANGTKSVTTRRQVSGTTSQYSLQYDALVGAQYTGTLMKVGGAIIGNSATLRMNADGSFSVV
jgi:hypothetical protein